MNTLLTDYWKLLDTMEDYLRGGVKRNHPEPPELSLRTRAVAPAPSPEAGPKRGAAAVSANPGPAAGAGAETAGGGGAELAGPTGTDSLDSIAVQVSSCRRCGLAATRNKAVPGEGVSHPLVMVIGEGPGGDEDLSGRPFVGPAGRYLDKWLEAIGLNRQEHCFIGNVVKCRPPGNRDPQPEEAALCRPFLDRQIELLRPRVILAVGRISSQMLIDSSLGIGRLRGGDYNYRGIPLVPTYHPSGVLRNPEYRSAVWEDLKRVKTLLDLRES